MNNATLGVAPADADVASATVNAAQQIGASLGTALLSTLAASATTSFIAGQRPTPALMAQPRSTDNTTAFTVSAGVFAAAAVIAGLLFTRNQEQPVIAGEPVLAA